MIVKNNPTPLIRPGANFVSNTNLTANAPQQIFAPGANTRGAIVWLAEQYSLNASGNSQVALLAKASAPTTVVDGIALATTQSAGTATNFSSNLRLVVPYFIPAGLGLYFISQLGETGGHRSCSYTLL